MLNRHKAARAGLFVLGFFYRLALFPWLLGQAVCWTIASQTNWLLTAQTFETLAENSRKSSRDLYDLYDRKLRK
jgi:hypothetical protein